MNRNNGSKSKYRRTQIRNLSGSYNIDIRPLTAKELQDLLKTARESGWYGNFELLKYLLDRGLKYDRAKIDINKLDLSLITLIAREIWVTTLEALAETVNRVVAEFGIGNRFKPIKVMRYAFADLATPSLLWFISRDMEKIDVEAYIREIVNYMVMNIKIGEKLLSDEEKRNYVEEKFGDICRWLLKENGIDGNFSEALPGNIFRTIAERLYASLKITDTLDWQQYFKIVYYFNVCVEKLILQSNQLGGIQTEKPVFVTGFPSFYGLVQYPRSLPFEIVLALATDIYSRKKTKLPKQHDKVAKKHFQDSLKEMSEKKPDPGQDQADIVLELLNVFASKLRSRKFLNRTCYAYWNEFGKSIQSYIQKSVRDYREQSTLADIPDGYVLVEGASERLCFESFLSLISQKGIAVRVVDCMSKHGVYRKYRDIIKNESYIGAVVTVLDSDAEKEHKMMLKLDRGPIQAEHFLHEKGSLEDLFPIGLHVLAINRIYNLGEQITESDLADDARPVLDRLKKVVWNKKKVEFDKVDHAKSLCELIKTPGAIPLAAKTITEKAIELAQGKARLKARSPSIYTIDRLAKRIQSFVDQARNNV